MQLTNENYFRSPAMTYYWSVSQFKEFNKCEAMGLASVQGDFGREPSESMLVGSYVDAHFSNEFPEFLKEHPDMFNKRTGELKAAFRKAEDVIERISASQLMMDYLEGEKQVIKTAELFGVPWKIKMDIYHPERIVDLKVVKDMGDIWDEADGSKKDFIDYWGYDIQGAVYQKVEQLASGRTEPLPFYLAVATKEKVTDIAVIQIPQHILNMALSIVEAKIDRFDMIKTGQVAPIRCEHCDYCKETKVLTKPTIYQTREEKEYD